VPVAQAFAHQLHGELLLVEAVQLPDLAQEVAAMVPMDVTGDLQALSAEATAYLEGTAELLRTDAPSVDTIVVAVPPLANDQSTATRHDDDSIGSTRWA